MKKKLLILVSGSGSNAEAIVKSLKNYDVEITIACNRKNAGIYQRGLDIPIIPIPSPGNDFSALEKLIDNNRYNLVAMAGYMRVVPPEILKKMPPTINIHPSLLPKYKGSEDGYYDVIETGDTETGLTIHYVTKDVDGGPIIVQAAYDIPDEILALAEVDVDHATEQLKYIGLSVEHVFYPMVIKHLLSDDVCIYPNYEEPCIIAENKISQLGYDVQVYITGYTP